MSRIVVRRARLASCAAALVTLLAWLAAPAVGADRAAQQEPECRLAEVQPEEPLAMNTVVVGKLVKTIATEKEIFTCTDAAGDIVQIRDVETFVEIVEAVARRPPGFVTIARSVDVTECNKDLEEGTVVCRSRTVRLGTTQRPLAGCRPVRGTYPFEPIEQPRRPLEMNSVVVGDLVKTIKVDKEIFECAETLVGDVYLFTEVVERREGRTIRPVATDFDGIICFKDPARATVVACRTFEPSG
jgi:hypothetical protein